MRTALAVMTEGVENLKQRIHRAQDGRKQTRLQRLFDSPAGQPRHARMWPSSWAAIATPSATGSPAMPRAAWRPCWPCTSRLASPCHGPPRCWRPSHRRSGIPPALPPMKPCASGSSRPTTWTSMIPRSTPSSVPGSTRRSRCRAPVTHTTPEAIPTFQATCGEPRQHAIPPEPTRPVRVFSQDDSRVGWLPVRRRRLTVRGVQPVGAVQPVFAWCSVYGAVAPTTGARFCLERPSLNAESCQLCIDALAEAFSDRLNLLLLDNRGAHPALRLTIPAHVRLVC